jgi:hypothetical protein
MKGRSAAIGSAKSVSESNSLSSEISSEIDSDGYKLGSKIGSEYTKTVSKTGSVECSSTAKRATKVHGQVDVKCGECQVFDVYQSARYTKANIRWRWKYRKYGLAVWNDSRAYSRWNRTVIVNYAWKADQHLKAIEAKCTKNGKCVRMQKPNASEVKYLDGFPSK